MIKNYLVQLRNELFGVNAVLAAIAQLKQEARSSTPKDSKDVLESVPKTPKGLAITSSKDSHLKLYNTFIQDQTKYPDKFNSVIDERDEMYLFLLNVINHGNKDQAIREYLATGKQSLNLIKQICQWRFHDFQNVSSFLDFASGYGRLTRFLVQELPPDKIWICDIYPDAVKFQKEQFGVQGMVSVHNPTDFNIDLKYDCIVVGSLFSHLPPETFLEWLRKLYDLLSSNGILIFSVHDRAVLPNGLQIGEEGFLFLRQSESASLDKNEYGSMFVDESFVSKVIQTVTGNSIFFRKPKGLWSFQDIYIISKDNVNNFETLNISSGPLGYLEGCYLTEEENIVFEGWAIELDELFQLQDILIFINNKLVGHCSPSYDRPDIAKAYQNDNFLKSGFRCSFKQTDFKFDHSDIVLAKAINNQQIEKVLRIDTLQSLLRQM